MAEQEWSIEWLTDFAVAIKQTKLEAFKASIEAGYRAKRMGPGACEAVSSCLAYTPHTINVLAGLMPILKKYPEILDPLVAENCYWYLLRRYGTEDGLDWFPFLLWAARCSKHGWSLPQLKEARGEKRERETREPWYEGEAWATLFGGAELAITTKIHSPSDEWVRVHVRAVEVEDDRQGTA